MTGPQHDLSYPTPPAAASQSLAKCLESSHAEADRARERRRLARIKRLSWLLDDCIELPGKLRIGLDGIIGLLPGVGDLIGAIISLYILFEAKRLNVPGRLLLRMLWNVVLEFVVGLIPLIGDAFDFYFKANTRNLSLLKRYAENALADEPSPRVGHLTRSSRHWLFVVSFGVLALGLVLLVL